MTLQMEPDACDGILFSLLACMMRDDIPASQLKTIKSAWTAVNDLAAANNGLTAAFADACRTATATKSSKDAKPRFLRPLSMPSGDTPAHVI